MLSSLIIVVFILLWLQLGKGVFVYLSVELHLRVETVTVLRCQVLRVQNRVWFPTLSVPVVPVLLESTGLGRQLLGSRVLVGLSVERISVLFRTNVGRLGSANPLSRLN